ncbi:PREDICTED: cellular tumor antigen p53-like isoform X2 [Amphimedon queenslandica]|uniref:SAM domain-containing protein n=1 Tax=Amphimedon queenslandica TaxID=400682 RepID=A0AAN0JDR6_AMPQE|nr:PREDICTED: cellular tumor antigen p53-like isoform X2 [Amphimedon queenslandica]|eukprot:XP_019854848.1 PREDICTED: cellular tumor antigen p53-like isoform X2 [Amphimedon queenslandica]
MEEPHSDPDSVIHSDEEDLPGSQESLGLSQGTLNELMEAIKSNGITEEFYVCEEESSSVTENSSSMDSITIQRSLLTPASFMNSQQQQQQSQHMLPISSSYSYPQPPPPPLYHVYGDSGSAVSSANTTPTRVTPPGDSPAAMSDCSGSYSHMHGMPFIRKKVPSNIPMPGEYGFTLILNDDDNSKPPKTVPFTYSNLMKRAYIKRDSTVGMTFSFSKVPPPNAVIRAMAIHKSPDLIGDILQCCPKHIEDQKKRGHQFPKHFICGAAKTETIYCEDPASGRLSITMPISSLQAKSLTSGSVQAFFVFPCFTSELHKGPGQVAQLIFTLEIGGVLYGRAVVDIRVCASTGRDRDNDEQKQSTPSTIDPLVDLKKSRKRPALTQNVECAIPSKVSRTSLSAKQSFTVETYPELFPFVEVCVRMMERVHQVNIESEANLSQLNIGATATDVPDDPLLPSASSQLHGSQDIRNVESWLQQLNLSQYKVLLDNGGICDLAQVISLDNNQLKDLGVSNSSHREQLLNGISLINTAATQQPSREDETFTYSQSTQPYKPQLLSQSSTASGMSNIISPNTLEVLRIQVKKTYSSSSGSESN